MKNYLLWLTAFVFAAPLTAANAADSVDRPNIIFLFADDQCTYSMGCYGNQDVKTPNLDQLAREGMVFDNHYDTTAICMGSRANVFTGMFEYKTGCNFGHGDLLQNNWNRSYPLLLRQAGYKTAFAGKFGILVAPQPTSKGRLPEDDFDLWGGGPGQTSYVTRQNKSMAKYADKYPHSTLSYGAFGQDFIANMAKGDAPFCLSISFKAPHRPTTPDPRFDDVYAGKTFAKPKNYGREFGQHFSEQSRQGRQYSRFTEWNYDSNYDGVMAIYHQQVHGIDYAVGMIRAALKKHNLVDNTVIIYTSDNGFLCGSHGYGSKVLPYEESSRVPLIIFDPRHQNSGKQIRCQALTGNVDFAPTILKLAGVGVPSNMDGRNLLPLYSEPQATHHESLPLINVWGPEAVHSLGIVTEEFKYVYWSYAEKGLQPAEELFNTQKDPLEFKNIAAQSDQQQTLAEMRKLYDQALAAWQREAVPYHDYRKFAETFSRK